MINDRIPKSSRHKATGQAVVRLNGKDYYLGRFGSAAARVEYDALINRWLASGRSLPDVSTGLSVNDVILAYIKFAEGYYKPGSTMTTGELRCIVAAVRPVKEMFGRTSAVDFGPKKLRAVQQRMLTHGWCRTYINHQINKVRRMFRWATSEELLPAHVFQSLQALPGIRKGMTSVRESEPIRPVPEKFVHAALPFMPPTVATMVQLQLLTGCRPGEVCIMRSCDFETGGKVWIYRPQSHKTAHHGHERTIFLGPRAQALVIPWLRMELEAFLFSPQVSEDFRNAKRTERRRSPKAPSLNKRRRKRNRLRPWADNYSSQSYARAIARACERADEAAHKQDPTIPDVQTIIPTWTPNQLRHTRATQLRREHGLELTKLVLGHKSIETSLIYAERDLEAASAVMEKIG
jgi:integrase